MYHLLKSATPSVLKLVGMSMPRLIGQLCTTEKCHTFSIKISWNVDAQAHWPAMQQE